MHLLKLLSGGEWMTIYTLLRKDIKNDFCLALH